MSRSPSHSPGRDGVNRERRSRRARSRSRSRYRSRSWERGHGYRHTLNPEPNKCLGIFGLHEYTTERRLHEIFGKYGSIDKIIIIVDAKSGRSRGFGFAYFKNQDDAKTAKAECSGLEIDGRKIRVDFSITQRPHNPTPGVYMGKPLMRDSRPFRWRSYDRYDNGRYDHGDYYDRYGGGRDYDDYYDGSYTSGRRGYYKERRSPSYSKYRPRDDRSRSRSNFPRHTKPK